jgi:hypothetical protein
MSLCFESRPVRTREQPAEVECPPGITDYEGDAILNKMDPQAICATMLMLRFAKPWMTGASATRSAFTDPSATSLARSTSSITIADLVQALNLYVHFAVAGAVDDLAKADFLSRRFREHKRIKGQQQFVIIAEFVREDEANGDELSWPAPAFGGRALNGVDFRLKNTSFHLCAHRQVDSQMPHFCRVVRPVS